MALYHWKGIASGQHTTGDIEARDITEAKAKLQSQKIIFTDLRPAANSNNNANNSAMKANKNLPEAAAVIPKKYNAKRIKNRELMIFTKKFTTMVQSGLPILKTLKMLESQTLDKNFRTVVHMILTDVESGSTLSEAFSKHPNVFDSIYINLLKAGESSGKLTVFLNRLVQQIEKSEKIRAKVKGALTYPIILIFVAAAVIVLMLIKVVPIFQQMFSSMGHNLPGPTMILIHMSEFLRDPSGGGVVLAVLVGMYFGFKYLMKNVYAFRYKMHKVYLKIPLVRDIIMKSTMARIAMIQGNLSAAGVSVIETLEIVISTVKNELYKEAITEVKKGIAEGSPLSTLYSKFPIFAPTFCQMIAVGEETGNTDEMFENTARYYEEEFDMTVNRMTELLEPGMIVFMGITIGFIIVALYMPIFQIGQTMMNH